MQILRVSQINRYIRDLLDGDQALQNLWLEGEVSNFTQAPSGHVYFTLKDEASQIRCVMWRSRANQQVRLPRHGEAVVAHGYIAVYEAQGSYQFYVDLIQPAGLGALHLAFEALKARLEAEGLFAAERKRPLPRFPKTIGLVTSPQAAALRDILHILSQRYPLAQVILAPAMVQGEEAPAQIVAALAALNAQPEVEVIILARGGGSLEELWAFNDERVARAVAASRVPLVCGVGHETDFTIADFVADVRAPTPTAAAALVVPDRRELQVVIEQRRQRLLGLVEARLADGHRNLSYTRQALHRYSPQAQVFAYRQQVDDLLSRAARRVEHRLQLARERLISRSAQLASLSPLATLERGYAIVRHGRNGQIVRLVRQVRPGDAVDVRVSDGTFGATVGRQKELGL
jgi:exodeoxyribonuclease VII large subunit